MRMSGVFFLKALKIFTAFLILTTIFFSTCTAFAKPVRIVRLPIIFQKNRPDYDTCALLETKISRAVMIPLNGTLKVAEFLEPEISSAELNSIYQKMRAENKKIKISETMRPLSESLNADIIVCPILLRYSEYFVQSGATFESHLVSDVSAELIIYDRRTDELIDKKISRSFNDSSSKFGRASYLATDCFDVLLNETKLKRKIMEIK